MSDPEHIHLLTTHAGQTSEGFAQYTDYNSTPNGFTRPQLTTLSSTAMVYSVSKTSRRPSPPTSGCRGTAATSPYKCTIMHTIGYVHTTHTDCFAGGHPTTLHRHPSSFAAKQLIPLSYIQHTAAFYLPSLALVTALWVGHKTCSVS